MTLNLGPPTSVRVLSGSIPCVCIMRPLSECAELCAQRSGCSGVCSGNDSCNLQHTSHALRLAGHRARSGERTKERGSSEQRVSERARERESETHYCEWPLLQNLK